MNAGVFSVWAQNVTSPRRNARQRVRELLRDACFLLSQGRARWNHWIKRAYQLPAQRLRRIRGHRLPAL